ncbi:hypothetical protein GETHOR_00900 [Geothrix oryzae]|uniref:Uncharacterized protein n=1 Tax=Geothrix oryzae TaxID=2927975 RepID=A0ABN6UTB8_9BACT|nr:hypothetical protein [Geothrix oryzae]BDU67989.1 hypothetical protein GETHOR_00900 [Geothrix oryzae]
MLLVPALLLLLQTPVPAPAATPPPDPVPPARIELTTPFPVHLGSVGPREVREAVYGIKSTHDRPFHLRVLDLSLGLSLEGDQLAAPLQPGEVRLVKVKVDPTGLLGFIKGAVRLGTDDPGQPNYILRYDMIVRPEASVDAERKTLGEVAPHESPELRFHFRREGGDPLKLVLASELPPHLEAELIHEGETGDLRLTLRPGRLQPGVTAGLEVLKVATNAPKQPLFALYVDWRIVQPVMASPSRLVFTDPKTTLLSVELTARDGRPFRVLKAEIEGQGFSLLDGPGPEAARQVLRIRRTGHTAEAMLVLQCSNLEVPLKVPLRYLDPKARPAKGAAPVPAPAEDAGPRHRH